jgi:ribosome biogenesis GTPase / thiamine phosphate phosphatase
MKNSNPTGRVMRLQSGFYTIETEKGQITCQLRGRLKKGRRTGDIVAVGDFVVYSCLPDGSGVIEEILPRKQVFERLAPTARGDYRQIFLANAEQLVLVFSCTQPDPSLRMLDRFLVIAEKQDIPPVIVVNKVDLMDIEKAREMFSVYPPLGYDVLFTSAATGIGIENLHQELQNKLSALAGPSGVGKSSLLNAIQPELGLAVNKISEATTKGRHTTVVREMFPLNCGGYVVDLPGLRSLALYDTEPEELDGYFPELRPLVADCQFSDCTHQDEPNCAVTEAIEDGRVSPDRYLSYLRMRFGEEE